MLGRIRTAAQKGVGLLGGVVEADATYIVGCESNKHDSKKQNLGRGTVGCYLSPGTFLLPMSWTRA